MRATAIAFFTALVLAGGPPAFASEGDDGAQASNTPVEEIVVRAKKRTPPPPNAAWTWLRRQKAVLVAIDVRREPTLASWLESAFTGEGPPRALEPAVTEMCASYRFFDGGRYNSRTYYHPNDQMQAVRSLRHVPVSDWANPDAVVYAAFRCEGREKEAASAVARAWKLSGEQADQLAELAELDADYVDALAVFATDQGMRKPPPAGLALLLAEGDNPAKQYVLQTAKLSQ